MESCTLSVPVTLQSDIQCTVTKYWRNVALRCTAVCQSVTDPDVIVFHFHEGLSLSSRLQWQATNSAAPPSLYKLEYTALPIVPIVTQSLIA